VSANLTPEERDEFDELMYDAGLDSLGKPLPSEVIGERVVAALREAAYQAQRSWAGYLLDDILRAGALEHWKHWHKRREVIQIGEGGQTKPVTVTKAAAMGVRRRHAETGRIYHQQTMWDDMDREALEQLVADATTRIGTEHRTIATARRLLALMDDAPGAHTAREAAEAPRDHRRRVPRDARGACGVTAFEARGTRRPHARTPYPKGRSSGGGGKSGKGRGSDAEAPGCLALVAVGSGLMIGAGAAGLALALVTR